MMTTMDKARDKVRKCLARARPESGCTEGERNTARMFAQRIASKNGITLDGDWIAGERPRPQANPGPQVGSGPRVRPEYVWPGAQRPDPEPEPEPEESWRPDESLREKMFGKRRDEPASGWCRRTVDRAVEDRPSWHLDALRAVCGRNGAAAQEWEPMGFDGSYLEVICRDDDIAKLEREWKALLKRTKKGDWRSAFKRFRSRPERREDCAFAKAEYNRIEGV